MAVTAILSKCKQPLTSLLTALQHSGLQGKYRGKHSSVMCKNPAEKSQHPEYLMILKENVLHDVFHVGFFCVKPLWIPQMLLVRTVAPLLYQLNFPAASSQSGAVSS